MSQHHPAAPATRHTPSFPFSGSWATPVQILGEVDGRPTAASDLALEDGLVTQASAIGELTAVTDMRGLGGYRVGEECVPTGVEASRGYWLLTNRDYLFIA
jgi:hypothetical protein